MRARPGALGLLGAVGRHGAPVVHDLVVAGIFRFIAALAADEESGGARALLALLGVLALLLGIYWIVSGAVEVFAALSHKRMQSRGWTIFMGLLSVVAGVVVLVYPGISLATPAIVLGFWLLVYGSMEIVLAFRLRSAGQEATRVAPAT